MEAMRSPRFEACDDIALRAVLLPGSWGETPCHVRRVSQHPRASIAGVQKVHPVVASGCRHTPLHPATSDAVVCISIREGAGPHLRSQVRT